jgi:hypothetical protein
MRLQSTPNHAELSLGGDVLREIEFQKMFAPTTPSFLSADFVALSLLRLTHQITQSFSQISDGKFHILSSQIYSDEFHWSGIHFGKHILHLRIYFATCSFRYKNPAFDLNHFGSKNNGTCVYGKLAKI